MSIGLPPAAMTPFAPRFGPALPLLSRIRTLGSVAIVALAAVAGAPAAAADQALGKRDFERAVLMYGGTYLENLAGDDCPNYGAVEQPDRGTGKRSQMPPHGCRIRVGEKIDEAFKRFPVVMFYDRSNRNFGARAQQPSDSRGVYIYRFEAGKLINDGTGQFRTSAPADGQRLEVRAGDVVTWSAVVSNVENDSPQESIPFREILVTPAGTRIHHCSKWSLNGCDPIDVKGAAFGLCEGKVKQYDGRGTLSTTSNSHFQPLGGTFCGALAIIQDGDYWSTVFQNSKRMPFSESSVSSAGNSWLIESSDPPGHYRIEVRLSGKLVGELPFEVTR